MKYPVFHDVQQNTEAWEALRLGKATCSAFNKFMANYGKAFGDPAKDYALQIALERQTGKKADFSFTNAHMERGHEQEPIARMLYEDEFFVSIGNGGFFDWGQYGDSPDGLVGTDTVTEFKSVTAPVHYATLRRKSFDPAYRWQLVGHLDCTTRDIVQFCSYCSDFQIGKQLIVYQYTRDDFKTELEQLAERRAEFLRLVDETFLALEAA